MLDNLELASIPWSLVVTYMAAIVLASTLGGMLPEWIRLTHTRMQLMISFVGGVMLGIAVFHMLPHGLAIVGPNHVEQVTWGVMAGLVVTFFLLRFFHFHQHGPADFGILANELADGENTKTHLCSDHNHPTHAHHDHHHEHNHDHGHAHHHAPQARELRWMAVFIGLGLHTLLDGVALGAGIASEHGHHHGFPLPGFGIFLAVLLHKPLDAVSITSLMHPVTSPAKRLVVNLGFALMCPVGTVLFLLGTSGTSEWTTFITGIALAFSAGVFLCISLSDLLPEMEFHSHSRIPLSIALLLGIFAAWLIGLVEGKHLHHGSPSSRAVEVQSTMDG